MTGPLPKPVRASDLSGETLYGDDFDEAELKAWFADEEKGFYNLEQSKASADKVADDHRAQNRFHGSLLKRRTYPVVLLLGCADGSDFLGLGIEAEKIIAIEPAREWWREDLAGIPAEFRAPSLDGSIELPDSSVDLVVALGVLHHIANVSRIIAELARVLRPGGEMIVREPMVSMGDFRQPRVGLTARERGIPRDLMLKFHADAGLRVRATRPCSMALVHHGLRGLGIDTYDKPWSVRLDAIASSLTAPFARYWRPRPWQKLAPASLLVVSDKP